VNKFHSFTLSVSVDIRTNEPTLRNDYTYVIAEVIDRIAGLRHNWNERKFEIQDDDNPYHHKGIDNCQLEITVY